MMSLSKAEYCFEKKPEVGHHWIIANELTHSSGYYIVPEKFPHLLCLRDN